MYQSPLMLGLYSPEEDLSTPTNNHAHIHVYPGAHPRTSWAWAPHTPVHTYAQMHTPAHATHPGIPAHTPQIPADTINLINHVKLYINRPNTKKADR